VKKWQIVEKKGKYGQNPPKKHTQKAIYMPGDICAQISAKHENELWISRGVWVFGVNRSSNLHIHTYIQVGIVVSINTHPYAKATRSGDNR